MEKATSTEMTLRELFSLTPQTLAPLLKVSLEPGSEELDLKKLKQWKSMELSPHFAELVSEHVCGFLTESVAGVLAGAWHTYRELRQAGSETLADPGLHSEVVLSDHEFSCDLTPSLDVLAGGFKLGAITFDITTRFTLHGLTLSIRHGCVDAIRSGKADCSLLILCGGSTVLSRTLLAVNLPGTVRLSKPILVASQSALHAGMAH